MILVDSSVWIDWFAVRDTIQVKVLEHLLTEGQVVLVGDLVLTEVLQGIRESEAFDRTLARLSLFDQVRISDRHVAITAARYYRDLRARGITPRKTIDTLIATRCIVNDIMLLYSDRDFDPFVQHLGLRSALNETGVT